MAENEREVNVLCRRRRSQSPTRLLEWRNGEIDRGGAGSQPDTHGRIGGGRDGGLEKEEKKRKTQEVALHQ